MKQIIRYLYEYENGERIRNIGFIKMEKQSEQYMVQIHGKGLNFGSEKKMTLYVFYMKNGQCIGVRQGVLDEMASAVNCVLRFDVEDMGGKEAFEAAAGLIIRNAEGQNYAAVWTDAAVSVESMKTREELEEAKEEVKEVLQEAVQEASQEEPAEEKSETLIEHVEKIVKKQEVQTAPEEEVDAYIPPKTRVYKKIQRQDIAKLPRREWKLANNSFLLHGFYNYHHLLYIQEDGKSWIGVPGIYHEKERAAARAFGFPQFHRITDADIELSNEEQNTYDDFGYWCRQIES